MRQASGVAPVMRRRATRCSETARVARLLRALRAIAVDDVAPIVDAGRVDRNPLELRDAGDALLDLDRAVVGDRHERHGFRRRPR